MVGVFAAVVLAAILLIGVTTAFAGAPTVVGGDSPTGYFLCPSVGAGVENSPHLSTGTLPSGGDTFLPGHNQAGLNVNVNGTNGDGGPADSPGPGNGNSNWSPIWNINP
jgi:hypothetical protein